MKEEAKRLTGITEGYVYHDTVRKRKDGSLIPVSISSASLKLDQHLGNVVQYKDITERMNMEEQLRKYSEHLEEKVEEKTNQLKKAQEQLLKAERLAAIGEVATMVGHDLRNPLQAITNTLYLSRKKSESIPITEREILEKRGFLDLSSGLKEQVEYMDKIVSDLQDYARLVKPMPVEIGLTQLINKTLSSLTVPENVKVSIMIEENCPKLMLDPALMQRVFSNLITNAVQAMPDGGQLTIRASKKEGTALISVEDTGAGIPDENRSKLFTPLFTTKAKGQGFGLAVCKHMVEAHDGNITVESKVGKGSTFTVKIPLRKEVG
jgi:signal transduction histidine kinase